MKQHLQKPSEVEVHSRQRWGAWTACANVLRQRELGTLRNHKVSVLVLVLRGPRP